MYSHAELCPHVTKNLHCSEEERQCCPICLKMGAGGAKMLAINQPYAYKGQSIPITLMRIKRNEHESANKERQLTGAILLSVLKMMQVINKASFMSQLDNSTPHIKVVFCPSVCKAL